MSATALIAQVTQLGIQLWADQGAILYRPKAALSPELATRLKASREEVLSELEQSGALPDMQVNVTARQAEAYHATQVKAAEGRANEPINWGRGQTRRLVGNGFPGIMSEPVPEAILATPKVVCPVCQTGVVLRELRILTGGRCFACWEAPRS